MKVFFMLKLFLLVALAEVWAMSVADKYLAKEVLDLLNVERSMFGCGPMAMNGALVSASKSHALDMATRQYVDVKSSDGTDVSERFAINGFAGDFVEEKYKRSSLEEDPMDIMMSWMQDLPFFQSALNCDTNQAGVSFADSEFFPGAEFDRVWVVSLGHQDLTAPTPGTPELQKTAGDISSALSTVAGFATIVSIFVAPI